MRCPLCLFWLCQGGSAAGKGAAADRQDVAVPFHLVWEWLAVCSAMLVALVLALAVKWLTCREKPNGQKGAKQEEAVRNTEELKNRLLQAFSQMEEELVKLMTLTRNRKANLITHHRGCRASDCQRVKENKDFNLAVYDIFED